MAWRNSSTRLQIGEGAQAGGGEVPQAGDGGDLDRARADDDVVEGDGGCGAEAGGVSGGVNVGKTLFAQVMEYVPWKTRERHWCRTSHQMMPSNQK